MDDSITPTADHDIHKGAEEDDRRCAERYRRWWLLSGRLARMNDTTTKRNAGLRRMLRDRRREMQDEVHSRIRDARADHLSEVRDEVECSDAGVNGDIELAVLQMKAEVLTRIDQALVRLDAGEYGRCVTCEAEISEARLRALPFAVRCKTCEEKRELGQCQARQLAQTSSGFSLFTDLARS